MSMPELEYVDPSLAFLAAVVEVEAKTHCSCKKRANRKSETPPEYEYEIPQSPPGIIEVPEFEYVSEVTIPPSPSETEDLKRVSYLPGSGESPEIETPPDEIDDPSGDKPKWSLGLRSQSHLHAAVSTSRSRHNYFPHETRSRMASHHSVLSHRTSNVSIRHNRSQDHLRVIDGLLAHFEDPNHPLFHHGNEFQRNLQAHPHHQHQLHHHHHHHHHHHDHDHHDHHHHDHHDHHQHHGHHQRGNGPILEEIPERNTTMTMESVHSYREAKRVILELQETNVKNDQIILFFVASKDIRGQVWNNDCNIAERAVAFMIKKIEAGGHLLKIHVGNRRTWLDPRNPWRRDPKFKITSLPTMMVCNTYKRINGKRVFDMEALISLFQD